uniref:uncharacterized protein LOC120337644 n=1 Tax=Styela clava TaxID=7725 RepID=UPI001939C6E2|nr:uncharacterized protein LOC120337644 [Styela clava]
MTCSQKTKDHEMPTNSLTIKAIFSGSLFSVLCFTLRAVLNIFVENNKKKTDHEDSVVHCLICCLSAVPVFGACGPHHCHEAYTACCFDINTRTGGRSEEMCSYMSDQGHKNGGHYYRYCNRFKDM